MDDLKLYFEMTSTPKFSDDLLKQVITDCTLVFQLEHKVPPFHLNDIRNQELENWDTSPGIPWTERGFKTKREVANDPTALESIRTLWKVMKGKYICFPICIPQHLDPKSSQNRNNKNIDATWDYPATESFMEACFALPLMLAYKEASSPLAYGFESNRDGYKKLFQSMAKHQNFMSAEYSHFDKTIPAWLIRIAFSILFMNMDMTKYQEYGTPDVLRLKRVWNKIVNFFIDTPFRLPNGLVYKKSQGVPIGSHFSLLINSIANWIVIQYCVRSQGITIKDHLVLGDNSLVASDKRIDPGLLAEVAKKFGVKINVENTLIADTIEDVKFLGYFIKNEEV